MIERFREFLRTGGGQAVAIGVGVVGLIAIVWSIRSNLGPSEAASLSRERIYVCSETGKPFKVKLTAETKIPVRSPHSGKDTGYPAELCFWTKTGEVNKEPTAVLLNQAVGKRGPTFCPDCGRLVTAYNPPPMPGGKPPPTKQEYRPEE